MSNTAFSSWPIDGSQPVVSFYYNYSWLKQIYFNPGPINTNVSIVPFVENPTDPSSNSIGSLQYNEFQTTEVYNDVANITFKNGSSVTFNDNQFASASKWGPNKQLVFRITDGNGLYLFDQGYVVINTDDKGGRFVKVYSGVIKYL
jgi:hypothetical protein